MITIKELFKEKSFGFSDLLLCMVLKSCLEETLNEKGLYLGRKERRRLEKAVGNRKLKQLLDFHEQLQLATGGNSLNALKGFGLNSDNNSNNNKIKKS